MVAAAAADIGQTDHGYLAPAMETLAVVAYRQPVLRAEIEAIRGVQCDDILRQLLDRDLSPNYWPIRGLGAAVVIWYDKTFLELFGLKKSR